MTTTPAFAQEPVYYVIKGTDFKVSPSGATIGGGKCPLSMMTPDQLTAAKKAANGSRFGNDVERDSAIHAVSLDGKKVQYLNEVCRLEFEKMARQAGGPSGQGMDPVIACSWRPPGQMRQYCQDDIKKGKQFASVRRGEQYQLNNTLPQTGAASDSSLSREQTDAIRKKQQEQKDAEEQCFSGTLERISQYWTKQRGIECVQVAQRYITKNIKKQIAEEVKHMEKKQATNLKSDGQGSAPGVILSMPSIVGVAQAMVTVAKFAIATAKVAADNAADLDFLLNKCLGLSNKLKDLQTWKKGVLNGLCKQAESLIERQLTQCIRVNVGFDLSLPQFSVMLQCPIVINANAYIGPTGARFDWSCIKQNPGTGSVSWMGLGATADASGASSATWGGQSLLSSSGGLENLFNGSCFNKPSSGSTGGTSDTSTRGIPGVDCGTLSDAPIRRERLIGETALAAGPVKANGWSVGGTDDVTSPSGLTEKITRCDFYRDSSRERTVYVYGSGASCNDSSSGFLDGGFETNAVCYEGVGGGYQARVDGGAIPDACLYPLGCLDTQYNFAEARRGTNNCTATVQPQLDPTRRYPVVLSTGGVGGGDTEWRNCSDFNRDADQAPVCCDPQKQDCRQAKAKNIPICSCDQGDSTNRVLDPATGKCEQGGNRTCCTPSLNGGIEGCTKEVGMASSQVCSNGDQCLKTSEVAGKDLSGNDITAGAANTAKPSPFAYLMIRPDVRLTGITNADGSQKQCCTTPWCNICPQHYANAYGMAMARYEWGLTRPRDDASDAAITSYNNSILGKGWPFTTSTNANGETVYTIGINPITLSFTKSTRVPGGLLGVTDKEEEYDQPISNPTLHMSDKMENKPSKMMLEQTCAKLGSWKIGYTSADNFGQGNTNALGYVYDSYYDWPRNKKDVWKVVSALPEPREMPLDYLNRLQSGKTNPDGAPIEPIELCSEVVKICTPSSNVDSSPAPTGGVGAPLASQSGNVPTATPQVVQQPAVNQQPVSGGVATPTPQTPSAVGGGGTPVQQAPALQNGRVAPAPTRSTAPSSGATSVPSVSGGDGTRGLF